MSCSYYIYIYMTVAGVATFINTIVVIVTLLFIKISMVHAQLPGRINVMQRSNEREPESWRVNTTKYVNGGYYVT